MKSASKYVEQQIPAADVDASEVILAKNLNKESDNHSKLIVLFIVVVGVCSAVAFYVLKKLNLVKPNEGTYLPQVDNEKGNQNTRF